MAEKLTNEQQAAVDSRERSLLVSAAAGSGKTKVLVERLFSYVEREGANLDDFLIITYTRAAASELRGKIAKALTERMERDPGNYHLRQQILRVYRADIKTVDAFCTALLRENCHLLGEDARGHALRPDFRVLDENEAQVLRERVLARTLDDFYDHLTPGGTLLADTLGAGRDDSALEDLVLELHAKLQAQPYEDKWLDAQRAFWRAVPDKIEDTPYGKILLNEVRRKARHCKNLLQRAAQEMCANDALNQKYAPAFLDASYQLEALEGKTAEGWDAARGVTIAFPRLAAVKDSDGGEMKARMKSLWDNCKETVKGFAEIFSASSDEAVEDLRTMAPAMLALIDLTADFSRRYNEEKRRRNSADFSDQEHEAIRLLIGEDGAPTELARIVSARYREIMVDEYQDTNEVQNRIFDAISCKGENLFTVGDVKQSIYRFRLADPRIFLQHYNTWPPLEDAEERDSAKLLLSRNFRSRKEVLDATNFIFCNILSEEMGELDYGADEMLRLGANYVESSACGAEFHLLDLPTQTGEQRVRVSEAEEIMGLDKPEHGLSSAYADFMPVVPTVLGTKAGETAAKIKDTIPVAVEKAAPVTKVTTEGASHEHKLSKIVIIAKQSKFEVLKEALASIGVSGMTVTNVVGCGVQKGAPEYYRGAEVDVTLLPKLKMEVVVSKVPVETVVETVKKVLYTGHIGDGKIFVYDVENVVKVRTGAEGFDALQDDN